MNVILDFDGTIADSFGLVVDVFQSLVRHGRPLPAQEVERLRGMPPLRVARELGVGSWRIPFLVARGRARMRRRMGGVQAFAGMPDVLKALTADGHNLYIMSSNSVQNIHAFLQRHDMDREFVKIYGGVSLFGKARVLRRVLRENGLERAETYYVGDEVRDIEAARLVGVRVAAVVWGFNNAEILRAHKPDALVASPAELAVVFETR